MTCSTREYDGRHNHEKYGQSAQYAIACCQGKAFLVQPSRVGHLNQEMFVKFKAVFRSRAAFPRL